MSLPYQGYKLLQHFLFCVDQHSLHSPFVFDFYQNTIRGKLECPKKSEIQTLRRRLEKSSELIQITDYGTGTSSTKRVGDIARNSLATNQFSLWLFRVARFLGAQRVLELGTSLGITSLYLAQSGARVLTIEGCPETGRIARDNFEEIGEAQIDLLTGRIEDRLPDLVPTETFDLVFIDANHGQDPTLDYFQQCRSIVNRNGAVIIHDIHQNPGMGRAWKEIKKDPSIQTLDIYQAGVVLFRETYDHRNWRLSF